MRLVPGGLALAALALGALAVAPVSASAYHDDAAVRDALEAIPGVHAALSTGHERRAAVLVNRWLAPRIAAAYDAAAIGPTLGSSAHDMLNAFATRTAGVFCDGAADALVASLRLLGIAASRFDFGSDGFTHTTVVVSAQGRYWLVDPTFALDLRGADGRPLNLVAAWQAAADGTRNAVTMRTIDLSHRPMVGGAQHDATCGDDMSRWTMCALPTYLRSVATDMRTAGYPTGERGLLLMSLQSPLFEPDFYGVPASLASMRASVGREARPVRIISTVRSGSRLVVSVRNVRAYPVPAVVTAVAATATQSRAIVVSGGGVERIVLHASAAGRLGARVTVPRYAA